MILLLFILLSLHSIAKVHSQTCEPWNASPPECSTVLQSYSSNGNFSQVFIFVPTNVSQIQLSQTAIQKMKSFNNPLINPKCRSTLIEFVCMEVFHKCSPVGLPLLTCRSLCQEVQNDCQQLVQLGMSSALPNCNATIMPNGQTGYPDTATYWPTYNATLPCLTGSSVTVPITVSESDIDCGVLLFNSNFTPPCVPGCRVPAFSKQNWRDMETMNTTLSFIGLFLCFGLLIVFCSQKKYRKYPQCLHIFITIGGSLIYFGLVIGYFYDRYMINKGLKERYYCHEDGTTKKDVNDPICGAQAALLIYGALSAVYWWVMVTFYLFFVMNSHFFTKFRIGLFIKKHLHVFSHFVGWGVPGVLVILGLFFNKFGFSGHIPWCFTKHATDEEFYWELGLYYIPATIAIIIGTLFSLAVIYKLVVYSRVEGYKSGGKKKSKIPKESYRILGFCFIWIYANSFIMGYRFDTRAKEEEVQKSLQNYISCYLRSQFYPTEEICHNETELSRPLWFLCMINGSCVGYLLFIFFGLTKQNLIHIRQMIKERKIFVSGGLQSSDSKNSIPMKTNSQLETSASQFQNKEDSI